MSKYKKLFSGKKIFLQKNKINFFRKKLGFLKNFLYIYDDAGAPPGAYNSARLPPGSHKKGLKIIAKKLGKSNYLKLKVF